MTPQTILRSTAWLICSVFLIMGCGEEAESPQTPKSLRQKIVVAETQQPKVQKTEGGMSQTRGKEVAVPSAEAPKPLVAETAPRGPAEIKTEEDVRTALPKEVAALTQDDLEKAETTEDGKTDPFAPLFRDEPVETEKIEPTTEVTRRIPLTPLEKIDLSQLKLVAIVQAPDGDRALVEEASGKGYIVTEGTYIGIHSGRIVEIMRDGIIVEEEVEDVLGKVIISRRELKLQKPPGEF
jgi:type IV pilus assembly protein PilP